MKTKKIADKIASRVVNSYMVLKVPLGYSLVRNAKQIIEQQTGISVADEDLEEIFARFLDLVVFGLTKDTENVGSSMPQPDSFYQVAKEVLESSDEYDDDEDELGDDDMDRFDVGLGDDEDEDEDESDDEGLEKDRF
jgi:hypothetical protein